VKCKARCRNGPSFEKGQYSVQCLASAAQHKLKVIYIIPCNGEYAALKEFAELEKTPNVPALDLPELDIVSTAKGFGCAAVGARTKRAIQEAFSKALNADGPALIAVPIKQDQANCSVGSGTSMSLSALLLTPIGGVGRAGECRSVCS
jgi:thiamine pyrophosphate-dependent acetolactate synthase large subunit-like protein